MGPPQTLPANFSGWDKPPDSLPANFDQWDKSAAPPPASGAPPKSLPSEGPVNEGLTTMETRLSQMPAGVVQFLRRTFVPTKEEAQQDMSELPANNQKPASQQLVEALSKINPIDTKEGSLAMNVGGTAANLLPMAVGAKAAGLEADAGAVKPYVTAPVRYAARAAEAVANSKLKPFAQVMTPADEAAAASVKFPGRDFGLPQPIRLVYPGASLPASPAPEQLNPSLVSPARTLPGMNPPEVIRPPAQAIPARPGLQLTGEVAPQPSPAPPPAPEPMSTANGSSIPRTLSGEAALREVLPGNKADLMQIAKSRGLNVTREAQLVPDVASKLLINKIVNDFSPEELADIRDQYLENTRMGNHNFDTSGLPKEQAQEFWNTLKKQTYFPDVKISAAATKRTQAVMAGAKPSAPPTAVAPVASDDDLTGILQESLRRAQEQRANQ